MSLSLFLVTAVYDITVAFQTPEYPELSDLILGQRCQAEAFIRRIPVSEVPYEDEKESAEFIYKMFQEKVIYVSFLFFDFSINFSRIKYLNILFNMEHLMVLVIQKQEI